MLQSAFLQHLLLNTVYQNTALLNFKNKFTQHITFWFITSEIQ